MDFFGAQQDTILSYDTNMLPKVPVVFDKTAFVKFKVGYAGRAQKCLPNLCDF
jgi:hypothetical protein